MKTPNQLSAIREYLENLYIGWLYNPMIDQWNKFADFHNERVEWRKNPPKSAHIVEHKDGRQTLEFGKHSFPLRPVQRKEDLETALKAIIKPKR